MRRPPAVADASCRRSSRGRRSGRPGSDRARTRASVVTAAARLRRSGCSPYWARKTSSRFGSRLTTSTIPCAAAACDDRADRAADAHRDDVALDLDVAHAGQALEDRRRDGLLERQLDVVEGEPPDRLDRVDLDEAALADDRDPVAGPVHLGDDVRREEDRPALLARLADQPEERLLDERVEARRRLVEDQQVRLVLERDDQPDLLLVALAVLAEAAARVEIERLDQPRDVRPVDAAAQVPEVGRWSGRRSGGRTGRTRRAGSRPGDGSRPDRRSSRCRTPRRGRRSAG